MSVAGTGIPHRDVLAALSESGDLDALAMAWAQAGFANADAHGSGTHVVGDLDGDGFADVIDIDQPVLELSGAGDAEETTYSARSPRNRTELWARTVSGRQGSILTTTGDGGLVTATYSLAGVPIDGHLTLRLEGLDSRGELRWSRTLTGQVAQWGPVAYVSFPVLRPSSPAAHGAPLVHVAQLTWTYTGSGPPVPSVGSSSAVLIDPSSGSVVTEASHLSDGLVLSFPAGDLDSDERPDVVFVVGRRVGPAGPYPGDLAAFSGTGEILWLVEGTPAATFDSVVAAPGDMNGDGRADVVVGEGATDFDPSPSSGTYAYSGRGDELWSRAGIIPSAAGDIDDDGLPDVIVRDFRLTFESHYRLSLEAVRGDGTTLYRTREIYQLPAGPGGSYGSETRVVLETPDVDGDGIGDLRHGGTTEINQEPAHDIGGLFSGRSGRRLWSGEPMLSPGASLDGRPGVDLVEGLVRDDDTTLDLAARDGASRSVLWQQSIAHDLPIYRQMRLDLETGLQDTDRPQMTISAGDVDGDGVADIAGAVEVWVDRDRLARDVRGFLLSGRDGTPL